MAADETTRPVAVPTTGTGDDAARQRQACALSTLRWYDCRSARAGICMFTAVSSQPSKGRGALEPSYVARVKPLTNLLALAQAWLFMIAKCMIGFQ